MKHRKAAQGQPGLLANDSIDNHDAFSRLSLPEFKNTSPEIYDTQDDSFRTSRDQDYFTSPFTTTEINELQCQYFNNSEPFWSALK